MAFTSYKPSPAQQRAHDCRVFEMLWAGSAGPGKTTYLIADPVISQLAVEHERWRLGLIDRSTAHAIHFRREFPMLEQTVAKAREFYEAVDPGGKWSEEKYIFTFSCGMKVQFAHIAKPDDWKIYDSSEYTAVYFDELVQFTKEQYDRMVSRVRTTDPVLQPLLRVRSATNPEAGWVKEYFVDPAPEGNAILRTTLTLESGKTKVMDRVFMPALLRDNPDPAFRENYEANLRKLPAHIRLARLNGRWDVIQGAFFAEDFIPEIHVVKPYRLPSGWTKFRVLDWGFKTWAVVTWWAVDTDGCLICYRERSYHKKDAREVAREIKLVEREHGEWDERRDVSKLSGPADTQIWAETGQTGPTMAEDMAAEGVIWEPCSKGRKASAQQVLIRLRDLPQGKHDRPGISWFETCTKSVQTIPIIKTDPKDAEEPADGGDDHWLDNAFYACMYRPVLPRDDEKPQKTMDDWPADKPKKAVMGAYGIRMN